MSYFKVSKQTPIRLLFLQLNAKKSRYSEWSIERERKLFQEPRLKLFLEHTQKASTCFICIWVTRWSVAHFRLIRLFSKHFCSVTKKSLKHDLNSETNTTSSANSWCVHKKFSSLVQDCLRHKSHLGRFKGFLGCSKLKNVLRQTAQLEGVKWQKETRFQ